MISSAMAARFAFGLSLFASPILAATIGLGPPAAPPASLPAGSLSGPAAPVSAVSPEIVSLDGEALRELSDSAVCKRAACMAERLQSPTPLIGFNRTKAERAIAAFDEELLELFQSGAMQRSNVEGLFWRIGSPIADR